jgi:hypothetical protein
MASKRSDRQGEKGVPANVYLARRIERARRSGIDPVRLGVSPEVFQKLLEWHRSKERFREFLGERDSVPNDDGGVSVVFDGVEILPEER